MALPLPHDTSRTLPRFAPVLPRLTPTVREDVVRTGPSPVLLRARALAISPTTALVIMLLGLGLLFALPVVGLPFVALVVLPAVVYHLRTEHRVRLRKR
jgi:hypothetical protein